MLHFRFLLAVLAVSSVLFADGFIISSSTYLTSLSVKYHKVTCTIDNGVATTTVDQEFVNSQDYALVNGRYIFPVPRGAAVDQFKVVVDGEAKVSTIMSKDEARTFFTAAVKNSNQATLLEYTDNTAFTLEIGSVAPGASRRIQLSYVEVLPKTDGLSKYLYPLNTERFSMQLIDTVSITVRITNTTPITSVYAPSFPVTIERTDDNNVVATYTGTRSRPDRDFDLYYKLSDEDISFHLFPFKKEGEDGYFLMLITPKLKKPAEGDAVAAKDIVFTIDHSGSMAGTKVAQARDALRFCINRLLPDDYFNIVAFDNAILSNAPEMLPASSTNIQQALSFVGTIIDAGSTDIAQALSTSLARIGTGERPHYCIFLTDGQPTAGMTDGAQISTFVNAANTTGTRIFSVGFGFDVNTVLIDKISIDNGGFPLYCSPDQNIEEVIGNLYKRIESPILTSPAVTFDGSVPLYGVTPEKLTDLFSGSEIAVYGRYQGAGTNVVKLTGNNGTEQQSLTYTADFPDSNGAFPFVPRLWATQQIAGLMTKIKLQTMTKENLTPLIDSVKALSLAYGIVTPYTSSLFVTGGTSISIAADLQRTSGGAANDASNYMQGMQQNSNAAQTVVADTNALPANVAPKLNQMQSVGNKIFVFTADSVWKDAALDSTVASDTVFYGSDEYFALAAQGAELLKLLTVGNQAAFTFGGKNYLVLDNATSGARPRYGMVKPGAAARVNFSVHQNGGGVGFVRTSAMRDGNVGIYSVNGKQVARLSFGTSNAVVWTKRSHARAAGTYMAVYREAGVELVKRFLVE